MPHTVSSQRPLVTRVRRIKEQKALEQKTECSAVLQQIAPIRRAVNGLLAEVLEGHLREHAGANDVSPEQCCDELEQLVTVLRSYVK